MSEEKQEPEILSGATDVSEAGEQAPTTVAEEPTQNSAAQSGFSLPPAVPEPAPIQTSHSVYPASGQAQLFLAKARETIQFRKKAKLEKIMKFAGEKRTVTNDQVEKLLHISDATATRYLAELVRQGRLRRVGITSGARYEPTA